MNEIYVITMSHIDDDYEAIDVVGYVRTEKEAIAYTKKRNVDDEFAEYDYHKTSLLEM